MDWICNNAKLNEEKCKELRIDFTRKTPVVNSFTPNSINNRNIDIVDHPKILGMMISNDLKWNKHVASGVLKASRRLPYNYSTETSQSAKLRYSTNLLCVYTLYLGIRSACLS